MDFKSFIFHIAASFFIVIRRIFHLAFYPYRTMRNISEEKDLGQVIVIFLFVYLYFEIANRFRPFQYDPIFLYLVTILTFIVTVVLFYGLSWLSNRQIAFKPFIFTFAYTLIPTLIWFTANSFLYRVLPPPRSLSLLGKAFSMVFITFSISMLLWKLILWYLAIRFSSRLNVYKILYFMTLYACVLAPYAIYLYFTGVFRIPFV